MKTYVTYKGNIELIDEGAQAIHGTTIFAHESPAYKDRGTQYPMVELVLKSEAEAEIEKARGRG